LEANARIYTLKIEKMEASEFALIKQLKAVSELKISSSVSFKETIVTTSTSNVGPLSPSK